MKLNFPKYLEIAKCLIDSPQSPKKHFSFIVRKNVIESIGFNYIKKTHPMAAKFGYPYPLLHSEMDAILKFSGPVSELKKCSIVNVRLNRFGRILMSKPCKFCNKLLNFFEFRNIFFTTNNGIFEESL